MSAKVRFTVSELVKGARDVEIRHFFNIFHYITPSQQLTDQCMQLCSSVSAVSSTGVQLRRRISMVDAAPYHHLDGWSWQSTDEAIPNNPFHSCKTTTSTSKRARARANAGNIHENIPISEHYRHALVSISRTRAEI